MTAPPDQRAQPGKSPNECFRLPKEGQIDLLCGRRIYLHALQQNRTYEGLLEGLPTSESNRETLKRLVAQHEGKPYPAAPAVLIPPAETPINYDQTNGPYPFGIPSAFPGITCIGRFEALEPVRDKSYACSALNIIWFQDEWALPIDSAVLSQVRKLDWNRFAIDLDFD